MTKTTGNWEWYTPKLYIDSARNVLGNIDLDPASSDKAQEVVQAGRYFTIETNGLSQLWSGKVFMNPPYGSGIIDRFVSKLVQSHMSGRVTDYICLVNDCMDTEWSHQLLRASQAVCFVRGRIRFDLPSGERGKAPPRGQAIYYAGERVDSFLNEFAMFGVVIRLGT